MSQEEKSRESSKKNRYRYHIANTEVLTEDTQQNWMLSTLSET